MVFYRCVAVFLLGTPYDHPSDTMPLMKQPYLVQDVATSYVVWMLEELVQRIPSAVDVDVYVMYDIIKTHCVGCVSSDRVVRWIGHGAHVVISTEILADVKRDASCPSSGSSHPCTALLCSLSKKWTL